MAIEVTIWQRVIERNLFKSSDFYMKSKDVSGDVLGGKFVVIPQAGDKVTVLKNPDTFPLMASKRTDTGIGYMLDLFAGTPIHIQDAERMEISYDKVADVLADLNEGLREEIGDSILVNWLEASTLSGYGAIPAATVIRTTGDNVDAYLPSATGTRKKFTKEDIKRAAFLMNKQETPKEGRVALLSSDFLEQLQDDPTLLARDSARELDLENGVVKRLYGFDIMERSSTAVYSNAATPAVKQVDATVNAADNDCAVFWHQNRVERAIGNIDFYEDTNSPLYLGNVYNAAVRWGGRKRRKDANGIIAVVQAHGV